MQPQDLGANFFLAASDVGKPRAAACIDQLQALNKAVVVTAEEGPVTEDVITRHSVVVFTEGTLQEMRRYNAFCRTLSPAIPFIMVHMRGLCGHMFVDFGDAFTVRAVLHCGGTPYPVNRQDLVRSRC